jgi:O-antigen ligase
VDRPLGYGPGRFVEVSSPATTLRQAKVSPDTTYADAHNLFVEHLATTGLPGVALLIGFLCLAARRARGPMLAFAAGGLIVYLMEPQSLAVTPVIFLALGAASVAPQPTRGSRLVLAPLLGAIGLLVAVLLVGDVALRQADLDFQLDDARLADRALFAWPEASSRLGVVSFFRATTQASSDDPALLGASERAFRRAAQRDPDIATSWNNLADLQLYRHEVPGARVSFTRALAANPWSLRALVGLAAVETIDGNEKAAADHLAAASRIVPASVAKQMVDRRLRP